MAEITVDLESTNSEELISQGIKAFNLADFNTSVDALSRAVEILVAEHGDKHDSLGVAYFYYGKALLEVYREEIEPLGDAVPRQIDNDSDDAADESEETPKTDENVLTTVTGKPPEQASSSSASYDTNGEVCSESVTNGEAKTENASTSEEQDTSVNAEPTEEEPTDLQVAWEVLELAKMIFDGRGESGKQELAETFILLGEISLESENFGSAIDDIKKGLDIQKTMVEEDSRTLAETYYKLAVALSTNNQIDEAIQHFNISLDILKNRINRLKDNVEANSGEINEIESLIPEIEEKIADMKNFKEETTNCIREAMQANPGPSGPFEASTSSAAVNDISHLIKRKRKPEEEDDDNKPTKKLTE